MSWISLPSEPFLPFALGLSTIKWNVDSIIVNVGSSINMWSGLAEDVVTSQGSVGGGDPKP